MSIKPFLCINKENPEIIWGVGVRGTALLSVIIFIYYLFTGQISSDTFDQ